VRAAMLQDGAEFRIGNSVIRFTSRLSKATLQAVLAVGCAATREILAQNSFVSILPMNRLSVCIITLNEEESLRRAASLTEIADEIVVVDSGSTTVPRKSLASTALSGSSVRGPTTPTRKNYAAESPRMIGCFPWMRMRTEQSR